MLQEKLDDRYYSWELENLGFPKQNPVKRSSLLQAVDTDLLRTCDEMQGQAGILLWLICLFCFESVRIFVIFTEDGAPRYLAKMQHLSLSISIAAYSDNLDRVEDTLSTSAFDSPASKNRNKKAVQRLSNLKSIRLHLSDDGTPWQFWSQVWLLSILGFELRCLYEVALTIGRNLSIKGMKNVASNNIWPLFIDVYFYQSGSKKPRTSKSRHSIEYLRS